VVRRQQVVGEEPLVLSSLAYWVSFVSGFVSFGFQVDGALQGFLQVGQLREQVVLGLAFVGAAVLLGALDLFDTQQGLKLAGHHVLQLLHDVLVLVNSSLVLEGSGSI